MTTRYRLAARSKPQLKAHTLKVPSPPPPNNAPAKHDPNATVEQKPPRIGSRPARSRLPQVAIQAKPPASPQSDEIIPDEDTGYLNDPDIIKGLTPGGGADSAGGRQAAAANAVAIASDDELLAAIDKIGLEKLEQVAKIAAEFDWLDTEHGFLRKQRKVSSERLWNAIERLREFDAKHPDWRAPEALGINPHYLQKPVPAQTSAFANLYILALWEAQGGPAQAADVDRSQSPTASERNYVDKDNRQKFDKENPTHDIGDVIHLKGLSLYQRPGDKTGSLPPTERLSGQRAPADAAGGSRTPSSSLTSLNLSPTSENRSTASAGSDLAVTNSGGGSPVTPPSHTELPANSLSRFRPPPRRRPKASKEVKEQVTGATGGAPRGSALTQPAGPKSKGHLAEASGSPVASQPPPQQSAAKFAIQSKRPGASLPPPPPRGRAPKATTVKNDSQEKQIPAQEDERSTSRSTSYSSELEIPVPTAVVVHDSDGSGAVDESVKSDLYRKELGKRHRHKKPKAPVDERKISSRISYLEENIGKFISNCGSKNSNIASDLRTSMQKIDGIVNTFNSAIANNSKFRNAAIDQKFMDILGDIMLPFFMDLDPQDRATAIRQACDVAETKLGEVLGDRESLSQPIQE